MTTTLNSEMYDIWQDKYLQDVETFSTHGDFLICFEVSFMQRNKGGELDVPKEVAPKIYRFHRPVTDILLDFVHPGRNHEIYVDISNMLSMMDVPPHAPNWIVNGFRFCATDIAKESENLKRKTIILRLMVWVAKDDKKIDMIAKRNLSIVMRSRATDRCEGGEEEKEEEQVCSICLKPLLLMLKDNSNITNINIEGAVRLSACDHMFHKTCITKWFLESSTCPYCRTCCRSDREMIVYPDLLSGKHS